MRTRTLGDSDLNVSVITFGAWAAGGWMWGGTERKASIEAIRASVDHGATSIDTAPIYGMGLSEELVGEAIKGLPRDNVQILTKFGLVWYGDRGESAGMSEDNDGNPIHLYRYAGRDSIIEECENSLRRLGTDYIDLYQIHWNDSTTPIEESFEAVSRLKEQGKIRHAGVCNYNVAQMERARSVMPLVSNQVPYSMVKRDIEAEVVPYCQANGMGILAYSPLQRGLLTGKMRPGQSFAAGDHRDGNRFFTDHAITQVNAFLAKIKPIADSHNATPAQVVLAWTLEQPGITIALAGARNAAQAVQNANADQVRLGAEELALISGHLGDIKI